MPTDYRKISVDFDDEDFVEETQLTESISPAQVESLVNSKITQVRNCLSRGSSAEALVIALDNYPAGKDPVESKDKNTQLVMDSIQSVKSVDIAGIVQSLSDVQIDTLMKYIYKGMAFPEHFNAANLLNWHEKVLEVGGLGSIVRVLSDRRTV